MKLTIPTKDIQSALGKMAGIPGAHGGTPANLAVRFSAGMAGVSLVRFTGEAQMLVTVDSAVVEDDEGEYLIDFAAMVNLVGRMPGLDTEIRGDEKYLHFASEDAKAKMAFFAEEIKTNPPVVDDVAQEISCAMEDIFKLLTVTASSMSRAPGAQAFLSGVCIRMMNERLTFVATNNRRGAFVFADYTLPVDCILPGGAVDCILKVISGESGACTLKIGDSMLSIIAPNFEISFTLLAEKFPNMTKFIAERPSARISQMKISRDALLSALKACAPIGYGDAQAIHLALGEECTITADNRSESEMRRYIQCEVTDRFSFDISAIELIATVDKAVADPDGSISIELLQDALFIRQSDRILSAAMMKIPNPTKE